VDRPAGDVRHGRGSAPGYLSPSAAAQYRGRRQTPDGRRPAALGDHMSIRSIRDGGTLTKDPDAARVLTWDWDADLAEGAKIVTSTWHISPPGALVADAGTDSIASDGRSTSVR